MLNKAAIPLTPSWLKGAMPQGYSSVNVSQHLCERCMQFFWKKKNKNPPKVIKLFYMHPN